MAWRKLLAAAVGGVVLGGVGGAAWGAEPLTKTAKITLDPAGVLVVDGTKVFPITLTVVPTPEQKAPSGKQAYAQFADDGVMFMRSGGPKIDAETIEMEKKKQAAAAAGGMRCCPWMGWELSHFPASDEKKGAELKRFVGMFKDSPGMGLWKGADEPEWENEHNPKKGTPEDVANVARIIHETDANHPIWLVQAPRGTVASMKRYVDGFDIGGIDIYPVSYPPGNHTILANKNLSMVGDFSRMMKAAAGGKPFWMTLQIAFSGTTPSKTHPNSVIRFPTFPEQRFMSYEAIINGARGLCFFGGGNAATLNERDKELGFNWTYWDRVMKDVLAEIGPKSPILPALIAPDSEIRLTVKAENPPKRVVHTKAQELGAAGGNEPKEYVQDTVTDDVSGIEWLVREAGEDVYVLACKKEGATVRVRFTGLPKECKEAGAVVFEEPRVVEVKDGGFADWFGPYEVHVYRFARK